MKLQQRRHHLVSLFRTTAILVSASIISLNSCAANSKSTGNLVDRLDRNGDGALSPHEIPSQMKRLHNSFDIVDANGDGKITASELNAIAGQRQSKGATSPKQSTPEIKQPQTSVPAATGEGADAIRARLQRAINDKELPGAVVMFIQGGKVVFEEVYGYADREAKREQRIDDLFNLGSTSKPLAMTTVMTQVEKGYISLDDKVSRWMPQYDNKKLVNGSQAKRSPTVREMMSHTSGTFAGKCGERRDMSLLYMFRRKLKESAEAIAAKPLVYQPGEDFCYGGPSMQVMARVIEKITGKDFDEVAKAEVFSPTGMEDTFYRTNNDLSDRIPVIYEKSGSGLKRSRRTRNPKGDPFILAPGGIFSSAHDLARFVQMHLQDGELDGKRILSKQLTQEMRRNQIGDNETDFGDPSIGERNSAALGEIEGYGLGWILDEVDSDGYGQVFSHGGAWGTYIWGDKQTQLGAILLTQTPLTYATPVWNDVLNIARKTWTGGYTHASKPEYWKAEVQQMGKPGNHYIDPEILDIEGLMTFQDKSGGVWVAGLDPVSGLFSTADGMETLMDSGAMSLRQTYNGPEFGVDGNGWAVYYTKSHNGIPQIWRARSVDGKLESKALTADKQRRQSVLASKNANTDATSLIYVQGQLGDGQFYWLNESRPTTETSIVRLKGVDSPRWIKDSLKFVYAESDGKDAGQLKLVDTVTGKVRTITHDEGIKAFAYGWKAPEYNGDTLVLALVDYKAIGIWRDTGDNYWQRIATLTPPTASRYQYFGSPEPFVLKGKSYISLVLKDSNTRGRFKDSEVWVMSIDADPARRFVRRVDDGKPQVMRSDPETFVGENEVFLYYNAVGADKVYEIYRARTGLGTAGKNVAAGTPATVEFDCTVPDCPAIQIQDMPSASGASVGGFHGLVDATVTSDPGSNTMYLACTSVSMHESSRGQRADISTNIILASSNDAGKTWVYKTTLRPSIKENDPVSGKSGYASKEVPSLATGGGYWYLANLRFHDPVGGGNNRKRDSFHLEVSRAKSPEALASAKPVRLAGKLAAESWTDYRLTDLHPDLAACSLWLDPELHYQDQRLYMMSVCVPYDGGERRSSGSFYAVFELRNDQQFGKPRYLGKLGDYKDAQSSGADELSKADLTYARDGTLLFLTAPVFRGDRFEEYTGCYVYEVESLNPPRLRRDASGAAVTRAVLRSSDSVPSSASCAYDPGLDSGVILTRREMMPSQRKFIWSLHETGVNP